MPTMTEAADRVLRDGLSVELKGWTNDKTGVLYVIRC